jgi:O-antigen/teichoic acid export membrane protein
LPVLWLALAAGAFGLFFAWGVAASLLVLSGIGLMAAAYPAYRPVPAVHGETLRRTFRFSFSNYLAKSLDSLPARVMPLIVLGLLSSDSSGYYYTANSVGGLMGIVIFSVSAALLAEASHRPESLRSFAGKAVRLLAIFLVPLAAAIFLAARLILSVFPEEFPESAVWLLRLLVLSWLPASINIVFVTVARVRMKVWPLLWVYGTLAVLIIGGSVVATRYLGLVGIGVAWLAAQSLVALAVIPVMIGIARASPAAVMTDGHA